MSKSDKFELTGTVNKVLPGTKFEVEVKTSDTKTITLVCTISGKLRQNNIRIVQGDTVTVDVSPYDLTKGIITWRNK